MSRIQYYPYKRITVNERKYEQDLRIKDMMKIFSILTTTTNNTRGLISNSRCFELTTSSGPGTLDLVFYPQRLHAAIAADENHGIMTLEDFTASNLAKYNSDPFVLHLVVNPETFEDLGSNRDTSIYLYANQAQRSFSTSPNNWMTVFLVPQFIAEPNAAEVYKYVDVVATDLASNGSKVRDRIGALVSPYVRNEPFVQTEIRQFVKVAFKNDVSNAITGSNAFNTPFLAAHEISNSVLLDYELYDNAATNKVSIQANKIAIELGAVLYNTTTKTFSNITYFNTNKAFIASDFIGYNAAAAGESQELPVYNPASTNVQMTLDQYSQIVNTSRAAGQALSSQYQTTNFKDVVFIKKNPDTTVPSSYTNITYYATSNTYSQYHKAMKKT